MKASAITPPVQVKLGLDFDNTIVCYDSAIALLAEELFDLPTKIPRTKLGLRDYLRAEGREHEWTAFQGELYGPGMRHAKPFEGAITTMQQLTDAGHKLIIVSHRSLLPYAGPPHDLHKAARCWVADHLQSAGLFGHMGDERTVHFMETQDQKVQKITEANCRIFLDDLPELFEHQGFPANTTGIQFDPSGHASVSTKRKTKIISTWKQLPDQLAFP